MYESEGDVGQHCLYFLNCFRNRLNKIIQVEPVLDFMPDLSNDDKEEIRTKANTLGNREAVELLISKVEKSPRSSELVRMLIQALNLSGYGRAAAYLKGDSKEMPTASIEAEEDIYLQLVNIFTPELVRDIKPFEVSLWCLQNGLFNFDDMAVIDAARTGKSEIEGSRVLLTRVVRKPNWFSQFLVALRNAAHEHLADLLIGEGEFETEPERVKAKALDQENPVEENEAQSEATNIPACVDGQNTVGNLSLTDQLPDQNVENPNDEAAAESSDSLENDSEISCSCLGAEASVNTDTDTSLNLTCNSSLNDSIENCESDSEDTLSPQERASPEPEIKLRDYQMEVAKPALEGKNIIVCLPTGSGKTRVAVYITKEHLSKQRDDGKCRKVVVLVNKVPLVEQHYRKEFHPFLKKYNVTRLSGDTQLKISFPEVVKKNNVIICTAQILENALLTSAEEKDEDGVTLSDFSLLIIDECHHTQKGAVYNNIMTRYLCQKTENQKLKKAGKTPLHIPQILGLTASPGVGGAKNQKKAEEHILKICASLDAYKIMTVREYLQQLKNQVKEPSKNVEIAEERTEDPFGDKIKYIMREIQNYCEQNPISEPGTQPYEQWVVQKEKTAAKEGNRKVQVCAEHLRKYNDALQISDTIRMIDAYNQLKNFYADEMEKKTKGIKDKSALQQNLDETDNTLLQLFLDNQQELEDVAAKPEYENNKLTKLRRTILEEFTKKEEARGIIFTKTRQSAVALYQWIHDDVKFSQGGVKAHYLIGAGHNSAFKPMTQNEQREVLSKFRTGEINLLIATTVAEEGLDIKECNIVIRYGLVTNEIAMLQARGRARADKSTYALVAQEGSGVDERESVNDFREKMMYKAIQKVQDMPENYYLSEIQSFQMQIIMEKKMKQKKNLKKQIKGDASMVEFSCRTCNKFVCYGSDIQVIENMHHVNVSKQFKICYQIRENKALQEKSLDYQTNGEIACKECGRTWGSMMVYRGLDLPCLKIKNFTVRLSTKDKNGPKNPYLHKQWSELPIRFPNFVYHLSDDDDDDSNDEA
ncbi:interferon-induced helicase C domain-containing protein 1 [Protopterus annectens]|uniref:interferon-induced helicase C domain-containing protein 1 n=1 Tax=Protopterus annectens TaxID=7888 RepID=UPI001CFC466E|nr:interferon-induced helicase C domain-containing protein 1 [Protopterus annectens]